MKKILVVVVFLFLANPMLATAQRDRILNELKAELNNRGIYDGQKELRIKKVISINF